MFLRRYSIFCLILTLTFSIYNKQLFSQAILFAKVKSSNNFIVNIYEPINGFYSSCLIDTTPITSKLIGGMDSIHKVIKIEKPSFIDIIFSDSMGHSMKRSSILMFSGDSVCLDVNLNENDSEWIAYSGNNAAGHTLFTKINRNPYDKFIPLFEILKSLPKEKDSFLFNIDNVIDKMIKSFSDLKLNDRISDKYLQYMTATLKMNMYEIIIFHLFGNYKESNIFSNFEKYKIANIIFDKQYPLNKEYFGMINSRHYILDYLNCQIVFKYKLNSFEDIVSNEKDFVLNGITYRIDRDIVPFAYIENQDIKQDVWGLNLCLYLAYAPGRFSHKVIEQYQAIYPKSMWIALLEMQFLKSNNSNSIKYNLQSPILYIHGKTVISLKQIVQANFKNEKVFVDIWASWCSPCIASFACNNQLDSFLIKNNIKRLYISLDQIENSKVWENAIYNYKLGGTHFISNETFITNLRKELNIKEKENLMIPRYLIINENGDIVNNNAYSPFVLNDLKKQLTVTLRLN
jgi:thiol-disulfide isomerase/thioredoxin